MEVIGVTVITLGRGINGAWEVITEVIMVHIIMDITMGIMMDIIMVITGAIQAIAHLYDLITGHLVELLQVALQVCITVMEVFQREHLFQIVQLIQL